MRRIVHPTAAKADESAPSGRVDWTLQLWQAASLGDDHSEIKLGQEKLLALAGISPTRRKLG